MTSAKALSTHHKCPKCIWKLFITKSQTVKMQYLFLYFNYISRIFIVGTLEVNLPPPE